MDRYLGVNTKVSDIKLWEGTDRKSPGTAMWTGSTYSAVVNLTRALTIEPGASVDYKVTADITQPAGKTGLGEQYKFTITDMNFGGSPVEGLPFVGNPVQVSTISSSNSISITDETLPPNSNNFAIGGRDVEVGRFKLSAPNDEKVTVKSIKISNLGSGVSSDEIDSIDLYNGDTKIGTSELDRDIVFDTPIEIPASGDVTLTVKINSTIDIDNGDTFLASISDPKDIDATGDLFGSSLDLDNTWASGIVPVPVAPFAGAEIFTASEATVEVSGIQAAQSTSALQSAKNFKLGTVYVKNNNVEDIRLSTLKVNIKPTNAAGFATSLQSLDSIKNLRLVAPDGTTVLDSVTNLDSQPAAGATNVANAAIDYVVTFSLANEYTISKNTEVGFTVLADVPSGTSDAGKKVQLSFFNPDTTTTTSHLLAVGQSSGTQLAAINSNVAPLSNKEVFANLVEIKSSALQNVIITQDSDWDSANGRPLPAGSSRVVANWKIADNLLNEDAEVTELKLSNVASAPAKLPQSYHFSNFELYHDGVKVATAATMASDGTVTFGNGETTMFTVTDGDSAGKTLVVKADISSDVDLDDEVNFKLAAVGDLKAKGTSTGATINALATVSLTAGQEKLLKQTYATITKEEGIATNVAKGQQTELLRFTVTPEAGQKLNLQDLTVDLYDVIASTAGDTIRIFDVTNTRTVTLVGAVTTTTFNPVVTGLTTVTFADSYYNSQDDAVTFSVRVDSTGGASNKTYQIGIKYDGDMLQVIAPLQETTSPGDKDGFAPLGDKVVGPTVTATQ
jgi:hypothetical protein